MKNLTSLLVSLVLVISFTGIAFAESKSIPISCTIPAIPGVNAPPFDEERTVPDESAKNNQTESMLAKNQNEESPVIAQEDTYTKNTELASVKTIYSR